MAFFKFRNDGDEHTTPHPAPESVEAMRKRAKHRLIGAAVLVLLGVVGFPMVFDNQPRPIPVDLPINIPDKNTIKPLGNLPVGNAAPAMIDEIAEPAASTAPSVVAKAGKPANSAQTPTAPPTASVPAASRPATGALVQTAQDAKPSDKLLEKKPEKAAEKAVVPKPEAPRAIVAKPEVAKADGSKAQSLLEGKEAFIPAGSSATATAGAAAPAVAGAPAVARFVVQVGAFADAAKAREARMKLEGAGLKTYTQVVDTKDGKRIRVRVGPFETKAESDKAAAKVKKLDLPVAILEL